MCLGKTCLAWMAASAPDVFVAKVAQSTDKLASKVALWHAADGHCNNCEYVLRSTASRAKRIHSCSCNAAHSACSCVHLCLLDRQAGHSQSAAIKSTQTSQTDPHKHANPSQSACSSVKQLESSASSQQNRLASVQFSPSLACCRTPDLLVICTSLSHVFLTPGSWLLLHKLHDAVSPSPWKILIKLTYLSYKTLLKLRHGHR